LIHKTNPIPPIFSSLAAALVLASGGQEVKREAGKKREVGKLGERGERE
jgi:hypothetical protein